MSSTKAVSQLALSFALVITACSRSAEDPPHPDTTPIDVCGVPTAPPPEPRCGTPGLRISKSSAAFPSVFEDCRHFQGTLSLEDSSLANVDFLEAIEHVDGELVFFRNRDLVSLSGLRRVSSVGEFSLRYSPGLTSLEPLRQLRAVGGLFRLQSMHGLSSLRGLEGLQCVGELKLDLPATVTDISPLSSLRTVRGDLDVSAPGVDAARLRAWVDGLSVGGTAEINGEVYVSP